ncbi:Choline kinase [Reichenbachiella faecimaris]|uniref:Choline kinase n=1 Tax=Reichenbachiella faecimaris TaxID=692418 RepID=A0A1W2GM89_REIFA|nr:phosphocholine cytidylyltransferase family protein [Reichenbachiella faecimaris]SMD37767.1 Choline kinase [Reichenbachiella faecimaris]
MSNQNIKTAVILAAGRGTRLGDRTKEMPKGFLEVGGETLIERSIRLLKANGIEKIVVGVGHKGTAYEDIQEQYGLTIFYNDEYSTTESMYTLVCAAPHVSDDFLLLESDLLYDNSALETILNSEESNVILGSGFTDSGDEVYLHAFESGDFRYLSQDGNDKINAYAELVGICKLSQDFYKKMIALPTIKKMKYEYGFNVLSPQEDIFVEKQSDLVWCEIDDEDHLKRALTLVLPKLSS